MGGVCTGQKRQPKERQQQQELNIVDQPYLEVPSQSRSQPQSKPQEQQKQHTLGQQVNDLLILYKKFMGILDLFGSLDHLRQLTRERINSCIILRSNISIVIQNNIKRIMREQQIVKRVEESDQYLIYNDEKFAITFIQQMQKLSNIIMTELKDDEEFESAFPILIVSFVEIGQAINTVMDNCKNLKDSPLRKHSQKPNSLDSNYARKTTNRMSLQQ